MSEPRYISPMLDGFSLGQAISDHSGVECYPAMRDDSEKRYIVKKISLPASQVQVEALLLTGVYRDAHAVGAYYKELAQGVREEVRILEQLAGQRGFVPYQECQIEPMEEGVGYEVHLLSRYRKSLERYTRRTPMTHLGALNLGIDLCAALAVCREAGWLYVDLKPENIYLFNDQEYRIGDLGFVGLDSLEYASLPDRYRSIYTAPEVADAYSRLNATMDTYALGLILYQIYNGGKLPFTDDESRRAWLNRLSDGEPMEPPVCADPEMAEIICKACAYSPADRWQTPAQMGHAIISYMQRNGAEDVPIVPPAPPEEEEIEEESVEETVSETAESDINVEDSSENSTEITEQVDDSEASTSEPGECVEEESEESTETDPIVESEPEESTASDTEVEESVEPDQDVAEDAPQEPSDWIDLADAILSAEEDPDDVPADPEEPTLRELLEDTDEMISEAEALSGEELSGEAADILTVADELIEHEAPAPVVAPEPIDIPIPEPIVIEPDPEDEPAAESDEAPTEEAEEAPAEPEDPPAEAEEPAKHPGLWKKLLGTAAALLAAAGLAFGIWYYYQNIYLQTIDSLSYDGHGTQVTVTVATAMDESKLTVICKDTYGNAVEGKLSNGIVTFSDLVPGSQYIISLEPDGFHKLLGTTTFTYSTPAETRIMDLNAVTGQEPGSSIISFGVEGTDSSEWLLTWTAEGTEEQSIAFTGHSVTVTGLTIGTEYTFTLTPVEEVLLVGENTIAHIASDLIQAQNVALADYSNESITLSWAAPEGISVERWIVRCYNGDGYDQLQEVTEPTAVFGGITEGATYTVEVTAANMTLGVRTEITVDASAITGLTAVQNGSTIELRWNYSGAMPENGWTILWSADDGAEQVLTAEENTAVLAPAAPGSAYTFTIQAPEDSSAQNAVCTLQTADAGVFSANKLDSETIIVKMCAVPTKSGWGYSALKQAREENTFQPGGSLALLYTVTKPYSFEDTSYETLFIIRDSEGGLAGISSRSRSWNDMWDNGYCTETVSSLPTAPGSYTLTICIGGGILAELPFIIQ